MTKQTKIVKPYGLWESPISAEQLASKSTRLGQIQATTNALYWLEGRPEEEGRGVIVRYANGERTDITPKPYNVRTRVHEYGGGDFWLCEDYLLFVDDDQQRLYRQDLKTLEVIALTPEPPSKRSWRYNDGDIDATSSFTVCVRERHESDEVINELVKIPLDGSQEIEIIAEGYDFYSNPRVSPDGKRLSWLCWSHPNMPWDETEVWTAEIVDGQIKNPKAAVQQKELSAYQPDWTRHNELIYAADYEGWWHLYKEGQEQALHQFDEIEFALPQWVFGCRVWQQLDEQTLLVIGTKEGKQALYLIDLKTKSIGLLTDKWTAFSGQMVVSVSDNQTKVYFLAANPTQPESVIQLTLNSEYQIIDSQVISELDKNTNDDDISKAQHVSFSTSGGEKAHGFFYPPTNSQYQGPDSERPPLIVMSHGGPTAMADSGLDSKVQFWTSRGFAVADVNYRGSTGYGRVYRDKLKGQWGLVDVDDCIAMGQYLAQQGLVDGDRMAIRGGSAGGYTTLCALTFHDAFKVGMSRYGVADLVSLSQDSHKFEIRYLDSVVGPAPDKGPEQAKIYHERSPVNHTDQLSCPILILQGLEDKVVPPNQAEAMVKALENKGLPYEYITFEGEGHGFRKPDTIIRAFNAELAFYQQYLI